MSDIQVGDTVRVTREFVVTGVNAEQVLDGHRARYSFNLHDVEVVEKRRPKVGDLLESREELRKLPENSVVTNALGRPIIVRSYGTVNRHGEVDGFTAVRGTPPYKVVSLGE
jgi:hypothetical protein